jgi:hypothetical protein
MGGLEIKLRAFLTLAPYGHKWSVSLWPIYQWGNSLWHQVDRRMSEPHRHSGGHDGEEKNCSFFFRRLFNNAFHYQHYIALNSSMTNWKGLGR